MHLHCCCLPEKRRIPVRHIRFCWLSSSLLLKAVQAESQLVTRTFLLKKTTRVCHEVHGLRACQTCERIEVLSNVLCPFDGSDAFPLCVSPVQMDIEKTEYLTTWPEKWPCLYRRAISRAEAPMVHQSSFKHTSKPEMRAGTESGKLRGADTGHGLRRSCGVKYGYPENRWRE